MAVERCSRCDRFVDLDWHVDEMMYVNNKPICTDCIDEDDLYDRIEELENEVSHLQNERRMLMNKLVGGK